MEFSHFDVGVGEPVDVHRCQVRTALHANIETFTATSLLCFTSCCSTLQTERRNKLQREKKTTSLLQTAQLLVLPLQTKDSRSVSVSSDWYLMLLSETS